MYQVMKTEVIASDFSCETCMKNEYLGFEVFTTVTIQNMVTGVMTPCNLVISHNLSFGVTPMWESDWLVEELYQTEGGIGQRGTGSLTI